MGYLLQTSEGHLALGWANRSIGRPLTLGILFELVEVVSSVIDIVVVGGGVRSIILGQVQFCMMYGGSNIWLNTTLRNHALEHMLHLLHFRMLLTGTNFVSASFLLN